jgi:hypothetical protein
LVAILKTSLVVESVEKGDPPFYFLALALLTYLLLALLLLLLLLAEALL